MNWNNLPQHLMDKILANFCSNEVRNLYLVSQNWCQAVDEAFSGSNYLYFSNIDSFNKQKLIRKKFKNVDINMYESFDDIQKIYDGLDLKNVVKNLRIEVNHLEVFVNVAKMSGNSLHSIELTCGDIARPCKENTVKEFENVRSLKISYTTENLENLCHNFKNLQVLQISLAFLQNLHVLEKLLESSQKTLREITFEDGLEKCSDCYKMLENLNLKKATFRNTIFAKDFPKEILKLKSLESLNLIDFQLTDEDILDIQLKLNNLQDLKLKIMANEFIDKFTQIGVQWLWKTPPLTDLFISNVNLEKCLLQENTSLTILVMDNVTIEDKSMKMIAKNSPNLKTLELHMFQVKCVLNMSTLKYISENCKLMEVLASAGVTWLCNENPSEILLKNLKSLEIRYYYEEINEILKILRAPKLQTVELSLCKYLNNQGLKSLINKSPEVQNIKLDLYEIETKFEKNLIFNFKKLKRFKCDKFKIKDAIDFLETFKFYNVLQLTFFDYTEKEKQSFLGKIEEIWACDNFKLVDNGEYVDIRSDFCDAIFVFA